jgi:hypothetical protein
MSAFWTCSLISYISYTKTSRYTHHFSLQNGGCTRIRNYHMIDLKTGTSHPETLRLHYARCEVKFNTSLKSSLLYIYMGISTNIGKAFIEIRIYVHVTTLVRHI